MGLADTVLSHHGKGPQKTKRSEVRKTIFFTRAALISNEELVKGVTLAYRRKQAGGQG